MISYYKIEDVEGGRLRSPSSLPELASLDISPEYLDKTHFRNPPKVEIGIDGIPRYRGEADDVDTSPSLLSAPLSSGLPLLTDPLDGSGKRGKRFDPYPAGAAAPKRSRRGKGAQPQPSSPEPPNQTASSSTQQPANGFPDPNLAVSPHHYSPYSTMGYYQVPGYPVPPPHPHMYPANHYPTTAPTSGMTPQQGLTTHPTQQHPYPGYPSPPSGIDPSHTGSSAQQPYYPYYHPAPGHYPGYGWPPYAGYGPQPMIQQPTNPASVPSPTDIENKDSAGHDMEASGAEKDV